MSSRSHQRLITDDIVFDIDTEYQIPYVNCLCTMASKNEISESRIVSGESNGNRDTIDKSAIVGDETESKEETSGLSGIDDLAAIPKGTIDPVYEAKARVLNHAVRSSSFVSRVHVMLISARFKKLAWDGINGNSSLLLDLAGRTTICGRLSPLSFVSSRQVTHW